MPEPVLQRTYDEAEELQQIRQRYENVCQWLPITLERLRNSPEFLTTYARCREAGLLDWHILSGIANITWNFRVMAVGNSKRDGKQLRKPLATPQQEKAAAERIVCQAETASDLEVPLSEFTVDAIEMALDLSLIHYLQKKGYVMKRQTPNLQQLRRFAEQRYRFMTLDADHEPVLPMQ